MSLSLSGEAIESLHPGHIQASVGYRNLYAEDGYVGTAAREDWYMNFAGGHGLWREGDRDGDGGAGENGKRPGGASTRKN